MSEIVFKLGKYQHYKSQNLYEVIGFAIHSETLEEMVIYKALYDCEEYGNNGAWVRPKKMFFENVMHNGSTVPRFKFIETVD
ncbi:MAG: DUF1653 domain-containing protein [Gammaproteobacteria bacterium]